MSVGVRLRSALHAEWTKLRTVSGPGWLLLAAAALTVAVSAAATAEMACPPSGCGGDAATFDAVRTSFTGVQLGQAVIAVLAVLTVGIEYSTGMMRTTLTAVPRRGSVLAAKAVTLVAVVLPAGLVGALGCLAVGRLVLPGHGFTVANGYGTVSLD